MHIQNPSIPVDRCFTRRSDSGSEEDLPVRRTDGGGGGGGVAGTSTLPPGTPGAGNGGGGLQTSLHQQLQRDAAAAHPRPTPILANGLDLCRETKTLLDQNGPVSPQVSTAIATTYGSDTSKSLPQKIAGNLFLDANLYYEEKLQHSIEHMPETLTNVRRVALLVNEHLDINGVAKHSDEQADELAFREPRIQYLQEHLSQYFPDNPDVLKKYVANDDGSDTALNALMEHVKLEDRPDARAHAKVLKMLSGQFPYFGGSVEYKENVASAFEFWTYHLSTITRDPARQYPLKESGATVLPKPMKDYATPPGSKVPEHNQRNLGTGVAESHWEDVTKDFKRAVNTGLAQFRKDRLTPPAGLEDYYKSLETPYEQLVEIGVAKHSNIGRHEITAEQLWDHLNEDQKKSLYGDIARVPWSKAHLHGGTSYEQTFDANDLKVMEKLKLRHPPMQGDVGLQNVAGVFGNVLQKTDIAWDKLKGDFRLSNDSNENLDKTVDLHDKSMSYGEFKTDFKGKQDRWYGDAYGNHQPIIGGMSGHTLGYMNLYKAALAGAEKSGIPSDKLKKDYPSLEMFRATMLAALIGTKRHHSYNEVMAASTGMVAHGDAIGHGDPVGYHDILQASDPKLKKAAHDALRKAKGSYGSETSGTVLDQLRKKYPQCKSDLDKRMQDYYDALAMGDKDPILDAKASVEQLIKELVGPLP